MTSQTEAGATAELPDYRDLFRRYQKAYVTLRDIASRCNLDEVISANISICKVCGHPEEDGFRDDCYDCNHMVCYDCIKYYAPDSSNDMYGFCPDCFQEGKIEVDQQLATGAKPRET